MSKTSSPEFPPDKDKVDLWLAGELVGEEADAIERYFEANPPEDEPLDSEATLERVNPDVGELIVKIKKDSPGGRPRLNKDSWREVVVPGGAGELGMLGKYEVEKVVATGGMGIVLKAKDPELGRVVALKVLSPALATNATARERFLREAQAAASLEHENILPIFSVHAEAVPYFAMRYVAGGTLQDVIDSGRKLELDDLVHIARSTAAALGAAHAAGIVHRDIKPANILLSRDRKQLWVCDFGIARTTESPSLTYDGGVAGTPHYMSPEQAAGLLVDGRSDFFSLGSVLYHCATGHQAFAGKTSTAVLQKVAAADPPDPRKLNHELPKWFAHFLETLLAKTPGKRFANAEEVIGALGKMAEPPMFRFRGNCWKAAAVLVAGLAITLLVGITVFLGKMSSGLSGGGVAIREADEFGYTWTDSVDLGGPRFFRPDIEAAKKNLFSHGDTAVTIELDPPFPFYGETYDRLRMSRFGYLAMGEEDDGMDFTADCPMPAMPDAGADVPRVNCFQAAYEFGEKSTVGYERMDDVGHSKIPGGGHVFVWRYMLVPESDGDELSIIAVLFDHGDILIGSGSGTGTGVFTTSCGIQKSGDGPGISGECGMQAGFPFTFATLFRAPFKSKLPLPDPSESSRNFIINGIAQKHPDIASAIKHAPPGALIGLFDDEPYSLDGIEIPDGKPLVFAPVEKRMNVLVMAKKPGVSGIIARSNLEFNKVNFKFEPEVPGVGLIRMEGAHLRVKDASFILGERGKSSGAGCPAIVLDEGASFSTRRSRYALGDATMVALGANSGATRITVAKGEAGFGQLVELDSRADSAKEVEISIYKQKLKADWVVNWSGDATDTKVTLSVSDAELELEGGVVYRESGKGGFEGADQFIWEGKNVEFPLENRDVVFGEAGGRAQAVSIRRIGEFSVPELEEK